MCLGKKEKQTQMQNITVCGLKLKSLKKTINVQQMDTSALAFAFHANSGDLELAHTARDVVPRLHVHGGRHEALAARDVGSRWLVTG